MLGNELNSVRGLSRSHLEDRQAARLHSFSTGAAVYPPFSTRHLPLLILLAANGAAADPVVDFITESDSIAQSGDELGLRSYVAEHEILLGAVVGQLVEVALYYRADEPTAAEENVAFAERLVGLVDSPAANAAIEDYRRWSPADLQRRAAGKAVESEAKLARAAGELGRAVAMLDSARTVFESMGDRRSVATIWGQLAITHWYQSDWSAARLDYERALAARRVIGDAILEGKALNGLGSVHTKLGLWVQSQQWYARAIALRRSTGDAGGLGTSLAYAANCRLRLGDTDGAGKYYEESIALLETAAAAGSLIEALNGYGDLQTQVGDYVGAKESYRRALSLAEEHELPSYAPLIRVNLANTLRFLGEMREAVAQLDRADADMQDSLDHDLRARLEMERSTVNMLLGEQAATRRAVVAAARAAAEAKDPSLQTDVALTTSSVYRGLGALDRALAAAVQARELAERLDSPLQLRDSYVNEAACRRMLGDFDIALSLMRTAREWDEQAQRAPLLAQDEQEIGNLLASTQRWSEARDAFRHAQRLFRSTGREDSVWMPALGIADTYEHSDPDSAFYWYEQALRQLEADRDRWGGATRRSGFLADQRGTAYEEITRYYAEQAGSEQSADWIRRALAVADRAKARGLREQLTLAAGSSKTKLDESALRKLQADLAPNTALLVYAVGDSASYLWTIGQTDRHQFRLPARATLRRTMQQLRDALSQPGVGDRSLRDAAHQMYKDWLAPAAGVLREANHLRIVRDDALFELPFSLLLLKPAPNEVPWDDLDWLTDRWSTTYFPSLSLLRKEPARLPHQAKFSSELLGVGGAEFSAAAPPGETKPLAALPHTLDEVESIREAVGADRTVLLTGAVATEAVLMSTLAESRPRILHLATHGIVDPYEPELSCVALSVDESNRGDGYWSVSEVLATDLPSELVVLSACETGRGRLERGEGVLGLTRAFLAAGATTVVASLWAVSDASTGEFMKSFYRQMYKHGRTVAGSLQEARLELRQNPETSHPFHWAAFVTTSTR
jgi:CHAT domain-containing protein